MFTASGAAPGLPYLRVKLHQAMQAQLRLQRGDISAITAALASINSAWRRLHPFHGDVLAGVSFTFVYIDLNYQTVFLASKGSCQAAACGIEEHKAVVVSAPQALDGRVKEDGSIQIQSMPLDHRLDGLVLGSAGLW